jgi:cyclic nucleotide gated channel
MILAFWNALSVPFFVAFRPAYENELYMFILNTIIDFIFCADVVLNFYTTYIDHSGEEVMDHKKIVRRYIRKNFWIDLVASVPLDNFITMYAPAVGGEVLQLTDMLKMIRILRLARIIRMMRAKEDVKSTMKLFTLCIYLLLWIHLTGCLWFMILKEKDNWIPVPDWGSPTTFFEENEFR